MSIAWIILLALVIGCISFAVGGAWALSRYHTDKFFKEQVDKIAKEGKDNG